MHRLRLGLALLIPLVAACNTPSARHPLLGRLRPVRSEPGYWIFVDDGWLNVRVTPGERPRRFQGSVTAVRGPATRPNAAPSSLGPLELDRPALAERVAELSDPKQGDSIQFDLEPPKNSDEGFRVRLVNACARFDLYLDGARRPERVHLGGRRASPKQVPFERCP